MSIIEPTHDPLKELREHIDAAHKILHSHANQLRIALLKEKSDPFEAWWKNEADDLLKRTPPFQARKIWDAAMKHATSPPPEWWQDFIETFKKVRHLNQEAAEKRHQPSND